MPDTYRVFASNRPDVPLDVDEAELIDLARQGLLVRGKGDINEKGRVKRTAANADTSADLTASLPADTSTTGA